MDIGIPPFPAPPDGPRISGKERTVSLGPPAADQDEFGGPVAAFHNLGIKLSIWLWGAVGLILATPLTASFAVLGKAVPSLRWLHVLAASDPAPPEGPLILTGDQPVRP